MKPGQPLKRTFKLNPEVGTIYPVASYLWKSVQYRHTEVHTWEKPFSALQKLWSAFDNALIVAGFWFFLAADLVKIDIVWNTGVRCITVHIKWRDHFCFAHFPLLFWMLSLAVHLSFLRFYILCGPATLEGGAVSHVWAGVIFYSTRSSRTHAQYLPFPFLPLTEVHPVESNVTRSSDSRAGCWL